MCGINLILSTGPTPLQAPLEAMQGASRFRGPDAAGVFTRTKENWQVALGVNRLQVVDRDARSNQPMVSACGNYVLAYNGEVYNYQDLKNRLINQGYTFATHSDTEVVLYWLQEFGKEGVAAFKGMFALVFIDLQEKKAFIARDRHGIKPLFWMQREGLLLVSSSINSLMASGLVRVSLNREAIDDYLAFRHVTGTHTFYREVFALQPGTVAAINRGRQLETTTIPHPEPAPAGIKETLTEAVTLMFDENHPPGLLLSGGVDSTLILAILHHELGLRGVNTYTLAAGADAGWARQAASQYRAHHQEIPVTAEVLWRLEEYLQHTDQPIGDMAGFATWLIAAAAGKNGNVLLSGAGADELFAGYNRHRAYDYYLRHHRQSLLAGKLLGTGPLPKLLPVRWQQVLGSLAADPQTTYANFLQTYAIRRKRKAPKLWSPQPNLKDNLPRALEHDRQHYLVADVLAITDNATMQHSVEARVPYLYDDVVAAAAALPAAAKLSKRGKAPLKELLAMYGGQPYAQRPKLGFGLPLASWLRQKSTFWLWEFLLKDSPLYEFVPKATIYRLLRLHRQGKKDYSMQLWSILVLENRLRRF